MSDEVALNTYKKGDVNLDNSVNVIDLVRLKKNSVSLKENDYMSDLNTNGAIGADDLVILRRILMG